MTDEPVGAAAPVETQAHPSRWILAGLGVVAALVVAVALRNEEQAGEALSATARADGPGGTGGTLACRKLPAFVARLGFPERSAFSTSDRLEGLVLVDVDEPAHTYQDPSWTAHGSLGPFTYDADGNIYVAAMPRTGMFDNPPEEQNTIFKVDTDSGVMAEFVALPPHGPLSEQNPFGILELTFDCDTGSLYASSVAGSTRHQEAGQIVRVDPTRGEVADTMPDVDAIGLGVFVGAAGRRLYFGCARRPEVWSVALDDQGDFDGPKRLEFKMPGVQNKAGEIRFESADTMTVVGAPFDYTLVPGGRSAILSFTYLPQTDAWVPAEP